MKRGGYQPFEIDEEMVGLAREEVEGIVTCAPFLANLDRPEARDIDEENEKRHFKQMRVS